MIFIFCFTIIIIVPSGSQDSQGIDHSSLKRCHISVSRERECQSISRCLDQTQECRCIMLQGSPGIRKTAPAIKVANSKSTTCRLAEC